MSRTDYHILNDPTLDFLEAQQRSTSQRGAGIGTGSQGEVTKAGVGAAEITPAPLLTPAELASAAAAAKTAVNAAKDEKTEEGKMEVEVKKETEGGDANNIPCTKTETPDEEKKNEGEVGKGEDETAASPRKEVKKEEEEAQPKVEKEEGEELKQEQSGDEEKTSKPADEEEKELTEEKSLVDSPRDQKEMTTELSERPDSSPKAQPGHKTVGEEDGEERERESPESPKSPKSADTEKSPEEEEEERMDEDDKSEKSSQAEGTLSH